MYKVIFMTQAQKDAKKLASSGLQKKAQMLIQVIEKNPYEYPPEFEYLKGDMDGLISRRINKEYRLVYEVFENVKTIKIYRMWTHYD